MKSEPGWGRGPCHLPQAVDVLSQASFSAGFIRLHGPWIPTPGITLKRKVISSVHPLFWYVQNSPKMWETEFDPSQAEQVLQPWRSTLTSAQPSQEVQADQTHGGDGTYHTPPAIHDGGRGDPPPQWPGGPLRSLRPPQPVSAGSELPTWGGVGWVSTCSTFLRGYTEFRKSWQSLP